MKVLRELIKIAAFLAIAILVAAFIWSLEGYMLLAIWEKYELNTLFSLDLQVIHIVPMIAIHHIVTSKVDKKCKKKEDWDKTSIGGKFLINIFETLIQLAILWFVLMTWAWIFMT